MKFPWTKEPEVVLEPMSDERIASEGWIHFMDRFPQHHSLPVWILRAFENPYITTVRDGVSLATGIGTLYWKPTAIYREVSGESI